MSNLRNVAPFRYDIVGSFLRPARLKEARARHLQGELSKEALTEVENEEIAALIAKEKAVGLKAVTDGEFRRRSWHLDFLAGLRGLTVYEFESTGFGVKTKALGTYVSSTLDFDPAHPFLDHFRFTQEQAGADATAKQTIPGPNMIYLDAVILSKQYAAHPVYRDHDAFVADLARTYQDAIQAFYDAGCRYLQLDDTSWGALFSESFRQRIQDCGYDPDALIPQFADITRQALAKRPDDMAITMHMCKGNFKSHWLYEGRYDTIASHLLGIDNFDGFFLEYDDERSGGFEPLTHLHKQKIVLGLMTTKKGDLESKDALIARIREAERYVPLEQICISPQCGFSSTLDGNDLPEEAQWKKLALLKETADEVFGEGC